MLVLIGLKKNQTKRYSVLGKKHHVYEVTLFCNAEVSFKFRLLTW